MANAGIGAAGTFVRVSDADPEMLRYLAERGIAPGARFEVLERQPFDGPLFVRFGDDVHVLGGSLAAASPGTRGTFVRISDSDPEMLRYLAGRGIAPGARFEVVDRQPFDGPLFVRFGDAVHVLGGALARAMRVEDTA